MSGLFIFARDIVRQLVEALQTYGFRLNRVLPKDGSEPASFISLAARSSDPADPIANSSAIWHSDGTGAGDDGDILMKITDAGGTTKTTTLVDFSAV